MFFQRQGNRKHVHQGFRRLTGFELLEDRTLLSINMGEQEVSADFSETGIPEGPPMAAYTGPGSEPLATFDEGDFYYVFDEQVPLDRVADQVLIRVEESADPAAVVSALTGEGGALEGFEGMSFNDPRLIALSIPFGSEVMAPADILSAAASEDGVQWSAPVFVNEDSEAFLWLTGEIIVALEDEVDPETFFASGYDSWEPFFQNQYIATPSLGGGLGALTTANQLSTDPDVEWATPNFFTDFEVAAAPNDPMFADQWHMNNTGQNNALAGADAELVDAWDVTTGDTDIVVAVLDNGVQLDHPDFNIFTNDGEVPGNGMDDDGNGFVDDVNGWDFAGDAATNTPDNDPSPETAFDNHGTAVAGIAAAVGNNSVGVAGGIQTAEILPIKIARDDLGDGRGFIDFPEIARAVYYASGAVLDAMGNVVDTWRGADILVNSWGGGTPNAALTAAFNWAATNGRNGMGVTSFNATGNAAAGTLPGLNYSSFTLNGIPAGNLQFEWRYVKNGTNAAGEDSVWLGNMQLPDGTTERFDVMGLPAGWTTTGNANWAIVDDPQHTYGTGRFAAQAGAIGNNQSTNLRSPVITVPAVGSLSFNYWISSETGADGMILYASLNGGPFTPQFSTSGVPLVTSNASYPASIASTIAVGASTDWDYRSHYSQYGNALDIIAPSGGGYAAITTTDRTGADGYDNGADYTDTFSGTSAATPLAAGIAALLLSNNADLTTAQIREILQSTADKIGGNNGLTSYDANGFNQFYGFGRVNAESAVDATFSVSGDYNRDRDADGFDFLTWQRNFGSDADPVGSGADGDLSGDVGSGDLAVWESNYGDTIPTPLAAASTAAESAAEITAEELRPRIEESTNSVVKTSITTDESSPLEVIGSLPSNLLSTAYTGRAEEPYETRVNFKDSRVHELTQYDFESARYDLPNNQMFVEDLYFTLRDQESEQSQSNDEVFRTLDFTHLNEVI